MTVPAVKACCNGATRTRQASPEEEFTLAGKNPRGNLTP
jgi:hypothetical protein